MAGLVRRAADEVAACEASMVNARNGTTRQLELALISKRKFLAALEARLAEIVAEMAVHEREQAEILAKLGSK